MTSPDPEFHHDARDFFTRHMRILEQCSSSWPMPEVQAQIDSLRIAFSADINRPFELKSSFPYGSPPEPYHPSPPHDPHYNANLASIPPTVQNRMDYAAHPITPPISVGSAGPEESKSDSSQLHPFGVLPQGTPLNQQFSAPLVDEDCWDPTGIIK